jgi:hypothetical protein
MKKQYAYFNELPLKTIFSYNGNQWIKQSTRTAKIVKPVEYNSNWFYFGKRDLCITNVHCRLKEG